jgi:hypothetical protein
MVVSDPVGLEVPALSDLAISLFLPETTEVETAHVLAKQTSYILSSGEFDGVVDLDAVLRDPSHPTQLLPSYTAETHLHPNNAGSRAEADAIPLTMFEGH